MNEDKLNHNLRKAIGLMLEESAPRAGWEQRVLDETIGKPGKRKWRHWWVAAIPLAAAAMIALIVIPGLKRPEERAETKSPTVVMPTAILEPQPALAQNPESPQQPVAQPSPKATAKKSPEPVVILPPPILEDEPIETQQPEYEPVADFIDDLLAQNIENQREILSTLIDPDYNTSYTPLE